jgi:predicted amidohydrolase YtcJ
VEASRFRSLRWSCLHRFAILLVLLGAACGSDRPAADWVLRGGRLPTVQETSPGASAIAIAEDRIIAVGRDSEVESWIGPQTEVVELRGRAIVPGFDDSHNHPLYGLLFGSYIGPRSTRSIDGVLEMLREVSGQRAAGEWILGWGFEETKLGRFLTRHDLDRVSKDHPVLVLHSSGHVAMVNSRALEGAGIDSESPDPPGGRLERDPAGELTGVVRENWEVLFTREQPMPSPDFTDAAAYLKGELEMFTRAGVTSIGDALVRPDSFFLYLYATMTGAKTRVRLMFRDEHLGFARLARWLDRVGILGTLSRGRLRVGPIKVFHGNSLSGGTCWLSEPYAGRPDDYGVPPARTQEELNAHLLEIHSAGFQLAVHSNGDREIAMVLDAFETVQREAPRPDPRHRIEHASVMNPELLRRSRELGVVLVFMAYLWEHGDKMEQYGEARFPWLNPYRAALREGVALADHSDYPISTAFGLNALHGMTTRISEEGKVYGAEQRIEAVDALRISALGGAYASFEEERKGSLEVGKLADLVVLSRDPSQVPPEQLRDLRVEMTFIGGERVYLAP